MTDIFNMEEEFNALIKAGQELIGKMKEKQNTDDSKKAKRWKPEKNEKYFYITPNFKLTAEYFEEQFDKECWSVGNCFKTKKEAQKERDRRIAEQELLDMCDDSGVIEIGFDIDNREFCAIGEDSDYLFSPYRFATEESAQNAIKQLGEDKLKSIFRID